ncbi:MAG: hypothetical protein LBF89_11985, partial [Bacteroidales bacterium]|nr:hypothetical protein [Bacteroidales bacterium]
MMKNIYSILLSALVFLASCSEGVTLYVSPDGDDRHAGTESNPLQTLEGARKAVRMARAAHPGKAVTVYFKGGVYPLEQTVRL